MVARLSSVLGDCLFKSEPSPTSADACGEVTSCNAGYKEVGRCSTKGGSSGMYITFTSAKTRNKAGPTLALKPRADITRNPKQGTSGPKIGHMCPPKTL